MSPREAAEESIVRSATVADLPRVLGLVSLAGLPEDGIADHLGDFLVVSARSTELLAIGGLEVYQSVALLRSVVVSPDARGRGLGARVVHACIERARERGVTELYLLTETAASYFPRFGFAPVARAAAAAGLRESNEFTGRRCSAATCMLLRLKGSA